MKPAPEKKTHDVSGRNNLRVLLMVVGPLFVLTVPMSMHVGDPVKCFTAACMATFGLVAAARLLCSPVSIVTRVMAFPFVLLNGAALTLTAAMIRN